MQRAMGRPAVRLRTASRLSHPGLSLCAHGRRRQVRPVPAPPFAHHRGPWDAERGFYDHGPTVGAAREWVLREPLEDVLPERYGVTSGEVRASDGSVSTQWDVLIINRLDTPHLFRSPGAAVVPVEGVLAAISVKSMLDKAAIEDAAEAAARLRSMPRRTLPSHVPSLGPTPAVFVFSFRGSALDTLREQILNTTRPDSPGSVERRLRSRLRAGTSGERGRQRRSRGHQELPGCAGAGGSLGHLRLGSLRCAGVRAACGTAPPELHQGRAVA